MDLAEVPENAVFVGDADALSDVARRRKFVLLGERRQAGDVLRLLSRNRYPRSEYGNSGRTRPLKKKDVLNKFCKCSEMFENNKLLDTNKTYTTY